ncbi:hypothetical protein BWD12_01770 [Leptospira santarosai serovar Bananal]|nr:hypothetical protein BWD12_01770 [Leptospira santarosai serovar Bananal]
MGKAFSDYISLTALLFLCFHSSPSLKLNFWVPILLSHSLMAPLSDLFARKKLFVFRYIMIPLKTFYLGRYGSNP